MTANLQLDNIQKSYGTVKALDSMSFSAHGGKIVVLVGVNGAGKTTLLRIIAGLEKPDKGNITFNNQMMVDDELRKVSTLVFQRTAMFTRSVYDNLAYGLRIRKQPEQEIKQKITEALIVVGLKNFEQRKARKTSGGEQQRLALARAFLLEPKILLLDEPTANLDPNSAVIIEKAILQRKNTDTVIVMATHNLNQAKRLGDEIILIDAGKVVEKTKTDQFFSNPQNELTKKFMNGEIDY